MTNLDTTQLTAADFEKARAHVWRTAQGVPTRLDEMSNGHLINLRRFLARRLEKLEAQREDRELSLVGPKTAPGFSGLEDLMGQMQDALHFVRIETERRLVESGGKLDLETREEDEEIVIQ